MKITIRTKEEGLDAAESQVERGIKETTLARVMQHSDGYWLYHKNKVELQNMFS